MSRRKYKVYNNGPTPFLIDEIEAGGPEIAAERVAKMVLRSRFVAGRTDTDELSEEYRVVDPEGHARHLKVYARTSFSATATPSDKWCD